MKYNIFIFSFLILIISCNCVSATWWEENYDYRKNIILIGPETFSKTYTSFEDGHIYSNSYTRQNTYNYIHLENTPTNGLYRGYIEWNISTIPNDANITNIIFKYSSLNRDGDGDAHISAMNYRPSSSSSQNVWNDSGDGTIYANVDGFPVIGNNQEINLGNDAITDLEAALVTNWFAIGFCLDDETLLTNNYSRIYSMESTSANPKPTLYVEYSSESEPSTNYQLLLNITYDSDMQPDFDDLRFCNETHELDSWLESKVDDSYALVWVEFPTTPANGVNQTYYMYYGNAGAASDWDIRATMLDGDDFTGAALDTNIWGKQYCDAAVSNGILTLDTFVSTGGRYACGILGKRLVGPSAVTEVRINSVTSPQCGGTYGLGTHHLYSSGDETGVWHTGVNGEVGGNVDNGAVSFTTDQSFSYNTYYRYKMVHTGSTVHYYRDGVEKTDSPLATNKPDAAMYMKIGGDASHSPTLKLDWIFARKYAANPPTYAFGSEEYYTPPTPTTIVNETKLIMSEITTGLKSINMGNYLVYAFILIGILLIILGIQIITNNMYRG